MEKTKLFEMDCFRIPHDPSLALEKVKVFDYDREPDEVAHWLKVSKKWQIVGKEKRVRCSIKGGDLVLKDAYLYGSKSSLDRVNVCHQRISGNHYLLTNILDLIKLNVLNKEQGKERMLKHTSQEVVEQMLQSV